MKFEITALLAASAAAIQIDQENEQQLSNESPMSPESQQYNETANETMMMPVSQVETLPLYETLCDFTAAEFADADQDNYLSWYELAVAAQIEPELYYMSAGTGYVTKEAYVSYWTQYGDWADECWEYACTGPSINWDYYWAQYENANDEVSIYVMSEQPERMSWAIDMFDIYGTAEGIPESTFY